MSAMEAFEARAREMNIPPSAATPRDTGGLWDRGGDNSQVAAAAMFGHKALHNNSYPWVTTRVDPDGYSRPTVVYATTVGSTGFGRP